MAKKNFKSQKKTQYLGKVPPPRPVNNNLNVPEIIAACRTALNDGDEKKMRHSLSMVVPYLHTTKITTDNLDFFGEAFVMVGDISNAVECYREGLKRDRTSLDAAFRMLSLDEIIGEPNMQNLENAIRIFKDFYIKNNPGTKPEIPKQIEEVRSALISACCLQIDLYLTTPLAQNGDDVIVDTDSAKRVADSLIEIGKQIEASITEEVNQDTREKRMTSLIEIATAHAAVCLVKEEQEQLSGWNKEALRLMKNAGYIVYKLPEEMIIASENNNNEVVADETTEGAILESYPSANQPKDGVLISLSRCLCGSEMAAEAAAVIGLALRKDPENPLLLHEMAWCQNLIGDYSEALRLLLDARRIYIACNAPTDLIADIDTKINMLRSNDDIAQ